MEPPATLHTHDLEYCAICCTHTGTTSMSPEPRLRLEALVTLRTMGDTTVRSRVHNRPGHRQWQCWSNSIRRVVPMHCKTTGTRKPTTAVTALTDTKLIMDREPANTYTLMTGHANLALQLPSTSCANTYTLMTGHANLALQLPSTSCALNGGMTRSTLRSCHISCSPYLSILRQLVPWIVRDLKKMHVWSNSVSPSQSDTVSRPLRRHPSSQTKSAPDLHLCVRHTWPRHCKRCSCKISDMSRVSPSMAQFTVINM